MREWQKASIILPHVSPMELVEFWLERTPASAFQLTPRQIAKRREKAFIRAGLLVTAAMARKQKIEKKARRKTACVTASPPIMSRPSP